MKTISNLREVLVYYATDLYHAEKQVQIALLKCISQMSAEDLKAEVKKYISSCQDKIIKLEEVFGDMLVVPANGGSEVMEKLLSETAEILHQTAPSHLKDAVFAACIQKICHYKIAGYGTCAGFATELKLDDPRLAFNTLLGWEVAAEEKLSFLAIKKLNRRAAEPPLLLDA
ncbi:MULTISPECIES: ferritin-like domain-containing protein [unclassified Imperialibacter]|uniref:YciE/YciF ferroxidase family protein n=1 Tax=unclassified Imperialibacter TaxID=2629706 RepID=UPI00125B2FD2|nr:MULTISPECIES: DUF892 family protein [unclassified Imperialibacter]CAD5265520.1 putative Protein YciF [Imperialibacter sp. 89]CAD5270351.1 putative Protein YciF [Imperialibacter sp. 75]VVT09994.1 putative Protein YciF [Imperialibacter sp. EC-SDR9]